MKQRIAFNVNILKYFFLSSMSCLIICSGVLLVESSIVYYIMTLLVTALKNIVFDVIVFLSLYLMSKKIDIIDKETSSAKQLQYKLGVTTLTVGIIVLDYVLNNTLSAFEFSYGVFIVSCILYFFIKPKPIVLNTIS